MRSRSNNCFQLIFLLSFTLFFNIYDIHADHVSNEKDLRDYWFIYHSDDNIYLPYLEKGIKEIHSIHFILNSSQYSHYELKLSLPPSTTVLINKKVAGYFDQHTLVKIDLDSVFNRNGNDSLFVTIFNNLHDLDQITTTVTPEITVDAPMQQADILDILTREGPSFRNFFIIGIIILLILYTILINVFSRKFKNFYDLTRTFSLNIREEYTFKGKLFSTENVVILFVHSLLLAFVSLIIVGFSHPQYFLINNLLQSLIDWFGAGFVFLGFFMFKYLLVASMGGLFKINISSRHFLEYLRMSKIFFALIFILLIVLYLGWGVNIYENNNIIKNLILIFLISRVLLLYLKFIRSSSFKNLYLFSYICSTEILPLVIGLKIFLNN
ncbi:MAG: DUF4271 domain-containing protein [Candidatus Cyclobacteriaceae bacterium M3_2C_046]